MSASLLTEDGFASYLRLRDRMLREEPSAFWSTPEDDSAQSMDEFRALMARPFNELWVVERAGESVAASGIYRQAKTKRAHRAHVWGVYCAPEHRGQGFARAVVEACITRARGWPCVDIVTLSVSASGAAALALYESLGFERWGTEPDVIRIGHNRYDEHHLALRL